VASLDAAETFRRLQELASDNRQIDLDPARTLDYDPAVVAHEGQSTLAMDAPLCEVSHGRGL